VEEEEDDEPEEIRGGSIEILELKRQLDETTMLKKSNKLKKRKLTKSQTITEESGEYLDTNILSSLNEQEDEDEENEGKQNLKKTKKIKISKDPVNENTHIRNL
jgi:hypothetical protein